MNENDLTNNTAQTQEDKEKEREKTGNRYRKPS